MEQSGNEFALNLDQAVAITKERLKLKLDIPAGGSELLVCKMILGIRVLPQLVDRDKVRVPTAYRRFHNSSSKNAFRRALIRRLAASWSTHLGLETARDLERGFHSLTMALTEQGAVIFGDLISRAAFAELVRRYDQLMG